MRPRGSPIYRTWHDEVSYKCGNSHYCERKSETIGKLGGMTCGSPSSVGRKHQSGNSPQIPRTIHNVRRKSNGQRDKGKKAICELGVKEGTPPIRQKKRGQAPMLGLKRLQGFLLLLSDKMEVGTTTNNLTARLPILNPGDYDLWLMRIEQYFLMTDYSLWEVIKNGNKVLRRTVGIVEQEYEPTTTEEK
ncbi:hypothetical protein Tco_0535434 [Tanacetum coccineum]